MPTLADLRVPPPRSWAEFEDIVCSAAKNRWCNPDFTHHGRQGQRQDGVDIYGGDHKERLVGIQCKNTWDGITLKTIEDEILKAESFQPRLKFLYLATTAETDKNVQRSVREISAKRKKMVILRSLFYSGLTFGQILHVTNLDSFSTIQLFVR